MKKTFFLLAALSAFVSSNAQVIYNNAVAHGLTEEGLRTGDRAAGGSWSEVQLGNMVAGFRGSVNPGATDRLADDFSVFESRWNVTGASLFMYQTDATGVSINGGLFEIRSNNNGEVGKVVSTGKFRSAENTDIYRIFRNMPFESRRIQKINVDFNADLDPGQYFLVWAATGQTYQPGPWNPYLTKVGAQTVIGANAMQSTNGGQSWYKIQDGLKNQSLPFMFYGSQTWNNHGKIAPEPTSLAILSLGLILIRRRRKV